MIYPVKKIFITQQWGVNGDVYAKFGFKGHNGIDLRVYDKNGVKAVNGELIAPHDGKIVEAAFDANGYGWYYKIENDKEGSILGHNKELFKKVGDTVKQGEVIAITNSTGWSTGSHVHWGYYLKPRDRSNGYGGTINQVPLIGGDMIEVPSSDFENLVKKSSEYDKFVEAGYSSVTDVKKLEDENKKLREHKCPIIPETQPTGELKLVSKTNEYVKDDVKIVEKWAV